MSFLEFRRKLSTEWEINASKYPFKINVKNRERERKRYVCKMYYIKGQSYKIIAIKQKAYDIFSN